MEAVRLEGRRTWRRDVAESMGGEEIRGEYHGSRSGDFFLMNGDSKLRLGMCGQEAIGLNAVRTWSAGTGRSEQRNLGGSVQTDGRPNTSITVMQMLVASLQYMASPPISLHKVKCVSHMLNLWKWW